MEFQLDLLDYNNGNFQKSHFKNHLIKNKNGKGSYEFTEANYKAGLCGQGHNLNASFTRGDTTYDAARKNMGYPWMMFTQYYGQELVDNTDSEWTTVNYINGCKIISKIDSSKYIFIPAAGGWGDLGHSSVNEYGYYWSTTIRFNGSTQSCIMSIDSSGHSASGILTRRCGYSVRAVRPLEW